MSATVVLHPSAADLIGAVDWGWEMLLRGYDVRLQRLYGGPCTIVARPAHTNINRVKRPRYAGQFGKARPDDLPPHAA